MVVISANDDSPPPSKKIEIPNRGIEPRACRDFADESVESDKC